MYLLDRITLFEKETRLKRALGTDSLNEMPKKVLVIGSGPIIIGQAAEFDYAGTQACRSLREEGVEVEHSTLVLLPQSPQSLESREREIRGHKELECGGSRGKCL